MAPIDGSEQIWGYTMSQLQSDIVVDDGEITGNLAYINSGTLKDVWGAGNFIALDFSNIDADATSVKVGMEPSVSSGLVELDEDHNCIAKVTDKDTQKFVVVQSNAQFMLKQEFDLSGLVCATS